MRILPINVGRTNVQNPLDFVTALLVNRHKRGRLRHRGVMREETLANSRLFKGIKDAKTGQVYRNDSYDSGYFDGVKLGGVRLDINAICNPNVGNCIHNDDGTITFKGGDKYPTLDKVFTPNNDFASDFYGPTGGHQPEKGGWYLPFGITIPYKKGSLSDMAVESFAGTHDLLGGQM